MKEDKRGRPRRAIDDFMTLPRAKRLEAMALAEKILGLSETARNKLGRIVYSAVEADRFFDAPHSDDQPD